MDTKKRNPCSFGNEQAAPLQWRLTELFWTLGPGFTRWAESHMTQEGLTPQRVRLMVLLLENGPMKMSHLRDQLGVTATNVTALVDVLEKDGMVTRHPHASDRRITLIDITEKAEKRLNENCAAFKDQVSELFSGFPATDQEQFVAFLLRMKQALVERNILES